MGSVTDALTFGEKPVDSSKMSVLSCVHGSAISGSTKGSGLR
jgi:hypothetical protein